MANRLFYTINNILSSFGKIIKHLSKNWNKYRKFLVILTFIGLFIYQLSTPEVKKSINNSIEFSILQTEKAAKDYITKNELKNAIIQYTNAVAIIISQKDMDNISISSDVQYRICTDAANTFIRYASSNRLDETDIKNGTTILNGLYLQKDLLGSDVSLDRLIMSINNFL